MGEVEDRIAEQIKKLIPSFNVGEKVVLDGEEWSLLSFVGGRYFTAVRSKDPSPAHIHLIELPEKKAGV